MYSLSCIRVFGLEIRTSYGCWAYHMSSGSLSLHFKHKQAWRPKASVTSGVFQVLTHSIDGFVGPGKAARVI